jgi:TonB family protein
MTAAVVNHLWQSTLFALMIALICSLLRNDSARIRYWLWWSASLKFLIPFSLLALLGRQLAIDTDPLPIPEDWSLAAGRLAQPFDVEVTVPAAQVVLIAIWAAVSITLLACWIARALRLRGTMRRAVLDTEQRLGGKQNIRIYRRHEAFEPAVVGLFAPVMLLPEGIEQRLTPEQMDAVFAHELCHVDRRDNLTAALHMLVEAFIWFHPLVWWIGARLIDERERACDEQVVFEGHNRESYAEGILKVCEHYARSPLACTAGISGSDLKLRITQIMRGRTMMKLKRAKKLLLLAAAAATLATPILAGLLAQRTAFAQSDDEYLPIVKVAPIYPPRAAARGLDGYVVVEYTVTDQGSVQDVFVVESSASLFDQAAIDAVLKFKYQPRITSGRAVAVPGVQSVIRFELEPFGQAI